MDEKLTNVVEMAMDTFRANRNHEKADHDLDTFISLKVTEAGYRLDPMPNGKSKPELIAIIEAKQAELDRARVLLRTILNRPESKGYLKHLNMDIGTATPDRVFLDADKFLTETSTVKL